MPARRCVAAAAVIALLAGCGSAAPSPPQRKAPPVISIIQDDAILQAAPARMLAAARSLGVDAVRTNLFWSHVAPEPTAAVPPPFDAYDPSAYPAGGWAVYDAADRAAAREGVRLYLTITGPPPLWAAGGGQPHTRNCPCAQWMPSARYFGAFVHALGVRYSGRYTPAGATTPLPRVSFWSIWNEPNYGPDLAPQAIHGSAVEVSPRLYRGLLGAAWRALAATGHTPRTDTILIGETAPRGQTGPHLPGDFAGMVPLRFIRALYCVDRAYHPLRGPAAALRGCPATAAGSGRFVTRNPALFAASGWADHPYPDALAPSVRTPPPLGGGYADFAALPDLEHALDRAAAAYRRTPRLPIYSTEFGYKTDPPFAGGLPPVTAASYLNQSEYLSWTQPRIRSYDQYLLADPGGASGSLFATGIEYADGRRKPDVFDSFRMPLWVVATGSGRLEVWGCARVAATWLAAGRPAPPVAIQFSRRARGFRTLRTIRLRRRGGCYYELAITDPGRGVLRAAWPGRRAAPEYSRPVKVS